MKNEIRSREASDFCFETVRTWAGGAGEPLPDLYSNRRSDLPLSRGERVRGIFFSLDDEGDDIEGQ